MNTVRGYAPDLVRACRDWALTVSASPEEVWAVAYSWAARQYRYEGADHEIARSLILRTAARLQA